MVARSRPWLSPVSRYRLGTALIWTGVLAWLPYFVLLANGSQPSILWFLPLHLLGVIGGGRLRATGRKKRGETGSASRMIYTAGRTLIFGGILVWLPYFYLKLVALRPVQAAQFLPYHLSGIFGGFALLLVNSRLKRRKE